jgi:DNA-binding response OmpR family regulator
MARRILVVEDDEGSRELVTSILTDAGYEVEAAEDGIAALARVPAVRPDLVLLDLMMPGLDGYEVCRRLKREPRTGHIPVIVVTAMGKAANMDTALASGADDFVPKPIEPANLRARVAAMLKAIELPTRRGVRQTYMQELQRVGEQDPASGPDSSAAGRLPPGQPALAWLLVHGDRSALRRYADALGGQGIPVQTAGTQAETVTVLRHQATRGVILGRPSGAGSALDLLQILRARYPDLPVIIVLPQTQTREAIQALKAGAADVLLEETAGADLVPALRRVLARPGAA